MKERLLGKQLKESDISIPEDWERLAGHLSEQKHPRILIVGGIDSGKSTLASYLLRQLSPVSFLLEADPGQPSHGLPGFFSLVSREGKVVSFYFVGEVTPVNNFPAVLTGIYLLARRVQGQPLIIDTSGYIRFPLGFYLKKAKILMAGITDVAVIDGLDTDKFIRFIQDTGTAVHILSRPTGLKQYTLEQRRKRRQKILSLYFSKSETISVSVEKQKVLLPFDSPEEARGRVFAFENKKGLVLEPALCLEIKDEGKNYMIKCRVKSTPEDFEYIRFGSLRMVIDGTD